MKPRSPILLFALVFSSSITRPQQVPTPRFIGVDDLFGLQEVHDPRISPDAQFIAFTVTSTSLKRDETETRIRMIPAAGGDAIPPSTEGVS